MIDNLTDVTDEDRTALKLKGFNAYIKFIDGELLYLKVPDIEDEDDRSAWFDDMEQIINGIIKSEYKTVGDMAINRSLIKYISLI
jgi:hypothetical protein